MFLVNIFTVGWNKVTLLTLFYLFIIMKGTALYLQNCLPTSTPLKLYTLRPRGRKRVHLDVDSNDLSDRKMRNSDFKNLRVDFFGGEGFSRILRRPQQFHSHLFQEHV